jgi:predicted RNase H-like HicB family nuclease
MSAVEHTYTVLLQDDDGQVSASVPDLPGVFATGDTDDEALVHSGHCLELWREVARDESRPAPPAATRARGCAVTVAPARHQPER